MSRPGPGRGPGRGRGRGRWTEARRRASGLFRGRAIRVRPRWLPLPLPASIARPLRAPNVRSHSQLFVGGFAGLIGVGAVLLALPWAAADGEATRPVDALFTAVSATCVTGLVTVDTASHWSGFGKVVILLLMQAGGLSFTVGASVVLLMLRRGQSLRDALLLRDGEPALTIGEIRDLARRILRFTLLTEAVGAGLLAGRIWLDGMALPRAVGHGIFYAVAAFTNASFDLTGGFRSLIPYRTDPWVLLTIAGLIQAGALSYLVLHEVWTERRWTTFSLDAKFVLIGHAALLALGFVTMLGLEWTRSLADRPAWAKPFGAFFASVATRSGGFAVVDLAEARDATLFLFIAIMAVGGAPGGTAGGVRLTTVMVVIAAITATLRGDDQPQFFRRRIALGLVLRALTVIALFFAAHFVATLALAVTDAVFGDVDFRFVDLLFEAMSALSTDGLSTGITPTLSLPAKLVLCVTMFVGRIGPLTAAVALQRHRSPARYRYPEAPVRIG